LYGRFFLDRFVNAPPYDGVNLLTDGTGSTVQVQNYALGYTWVGGPLSSTTWFYNKRRALGVGANSGWQGAPDERLRIEHLSAPQGARRDSVLQCHQLLQSRRR